MDCKYWWCKYYSVLSRWSHQDRIRARVRWTQQALVFKLPVHQSVVEERCGGSGGEEVAGSDYVTNSRWHQSSDDETGWNHSEAFMDRFLIANQSCWFLFVCVSLLTKCMCTHYDGCFVHLTESIPPHVELLKSTQ